MHLKVIKRTIHLTASFVFVLLLSACSHRNNFVVVNKSGEAIEVQYKLKQHPSGTPGKFVEVRPPAKLSLKDFEAESYDWKEVPKEQYGFDNLTGTFKVTVTPGEALLVDFAIIRARKANLIWRESASTERKAL